MIALIVPLIVVLIGGIAAAFQAVFAGIIGQKVGDLESVLITYTIGALIITLLVWLTQGGLQVSAWRTLPWYVFLSGPLGLVIVGSLSFTVPRLGAATAITLFIASWLILSAFFDHFGLLGFRCVP